MKNRVIGAVALSLSLTWGLFMAFQWYKTDQRPPQSTPKATTTLAKDPFNLSEKIELDLMNALSKIIGKNHVFVSVIVNKKMFHEEIEEESESQKKKKDPFEEEMESLPGLFSDLKEGGSLPGILELDSLDLQDPPLPVPENDDLSPKYKKSKRKISPNTIENIVVSVLINKKKKQELNLKNKEIERLVKNIANYSASRNDIVTISYVIFQTRWEDYIHFFSKSKKKILLSLGIVLLLCGLFFTGWLVKQKKRRERILQKKKEKAQRLKMQQEQENQSKLEISWNDKRDKLIYLAEKQPKALSMVLLDMMEQK